MTLVRMTALVAALCVALPVQAQDKPHLRDVKEIDDPLYFIAVANEIDEQCDSISGRRLMAINVLWKLKSRANELGYSDDEIRAYVESDAEKNRMRARGEAYIASKGVTYDKPESFCTLGRAEIARNSAIGVYLRAN